MTLKHLLICFGLALLAACQSPQPQAVFMNVVHSNATYQISERVLFDEFKSALNDRKKVIPKKRPDFSIQVVLVDESVTWLVSESGFVTRPKSTDIYKVSFNTQRLLSNQ